MSIGRTIASILMFALFAALSDTSVQGQEQDNSPGTKRKPDLRQKTIVKKMMIAVHRGPHTAMATLEVELKKEKPDWNQLRKKAALVELMGLVMQKDNRKQNSYMKSSAQLLAGIEKKEIKLAKDGFTTLQKSCAACHGWAGNYENLRQEIPVVKR